MHSKSTHSQKLWLNTVEHGHQLDWWPFHARLCMLTVVEFPQSQTSVQILYLTQKKQPLDKTVYKQRSCVCTCKKQKQIYKCRLKLLSCSICQSLMGYGNTRTPSMHCRLGSTTLSQLPSPWESDLNFPWQESWWENTPVHLKKKFFFKRPLD